MIKQLGLLALITAAVTFSTTEISASQILGFAAGDNMAGSGLGSQVNGQFNSGVVDNTLGSETGTLNLTALAKTVPPFAPADPSNPSYRYFDVNAAAFGAATDTTYDFTVTLTNQVGTLAADPDQLAAAGDDIGPIDVEIINGLGVVFTDAGEATSPSTQANGIFLTPLKKIRYGGLNGGGFAIANGQAGTLNFSVLVPSTFTGIFQLRFTANPEPSPVVLSLLAIGLIGGTYWFRRRNQAPVPTC